MICPVCGARFPPPLPWAIVRTTAYWRCPLCAYIQLESGKRLSPQAEKDRYLLHHNDPSDPGYRAYLEDFIARAVAPFVSPGARILDFGSGPEPVLSALLTSKGFRVSSYDPYFTPDRSSMKGPFDLIAVHEVAEHIARPFRELSRLVPRLSPEGVIAVRTRYAPDDPGEFSRWWYREDSTHIGFFGSRSMEALARRLGLGMRMDDGREIAILGREDRSLPVPQGSYP